MIFNLAEIEERMKLRRPNLLSTSEQLTEATRRSADDIPGLLTLARKQAAALEAVREVVEHWEQTPALRRAPAAACIRAALGDGDE